MVINGFLGAKHGLNSKIWISAIGLSFLRDQKRREEKRRGEERRRGRGREEEEKRRRKEEQKGMELCIDLYGYMFWVGLQET